MIWKLPKDHPKDDVPFIGDFGSYAPQCAVWSITENKYCVCNLNIDLYKGQWNDVSFENEWLFESELKAWIPMPARNS